MTQSIQSTTPTKLLRRPEVQGYYGTGQSQLYQDIADGVMTRPIKLSPKLALWPEHELTAVNAARMAGRSRDQLRALVEKLHAQRQEAAQALGLGE